MVGITTGGILNIVLDPVFIFGMDMGTAGAALATGISQFVSFCILLAMCNLRRDCISIDIRKFRPTLKLYGQILYGGVASLGRQGIASVATIIMNIMAQPYGDSSNCAMSNCQPFYDVCRLCHDRFWTGLPAGLQLLLRSWHVQTCERGLCVLH